MEILAPAGSILSLKAAIAGGANAVYLGLGEHNARIKSSDFSLNNLSEWVGYAHFFDVKVYVTINTAVRDDEMPRILQLAEGAARCGADALIVSDLGAVKAISARMDIPIHLSTQAGVQNALDAACLQGLKIKRMILSRETPLEDIREIKKYVDEIEIFVQGAICVSFSGGCLLGSKVYGQSGNRGVCNQACRLTYIAKDENGQVLRKGKLLSPRDLSLGEKVRGIEALGVDSIKIEGRLKRPAYVYSAVRYYRDILDGRESADSLRALSESFNRGYTDGYTLTKSKSIINTKTASHVGIPIGEVLSVETKKGFKFAHVRSNYTLSKGDGVKILRKGIEVGGSDVTSVRTEKGDYIIPVSEGVKRGDELRLTTNAIAVKNAESVKNALPVDLTIEGEIGRPIKLTASCGAKTVSITSDSRAEISDSIDNSAFFEKLSKVKNTDFYVNKIEDMTKSPIFIKISEINALRRDLLEKLRNEIIVSHTPRYHYFDSSISDPTLPEIVGKIFEISDLTMRDEYLLADAFVLSPEVVDIGAIQRFLEEAKGKKVYLRLPRILRNVEIETIRSYLLAIPNLGIYTDNLYGVSIARDMKRGYIAGFGLNIFNRLTGSFFSDADAVCSSVEAVGAGNTALRAGKVALMSFAHCPFAVSYGKKCSDCPSKNRLYYESNDTGCLILRRRTASCDFTMYEDKLTIYPRALVEKNLFYRFIGLNEIEKRDMMRVVSEDIGE